MTYHIPGPGQYRQRNGRMARVLRRASGRTGFVWHGIAQFGSYSNTSDHWTEDGRFVSDGFDDDADIVGPWAEVTDTAEEQARAIFAVGALAEDKVLADKAQQTSNVWRDQAALALMQNPAYYSENRDLEQDAVFIFDLTDMMEAERQKRSKT